MPSGTSLLPPTLLGQSRWYKMIVTVERSGKFNVEFEYKDDYQEGDIMKRS